MGLLLVGLLLVAAQSPSAPVEVPFRTVAFGANSQIKDGGAIVMRDAKSFDAYRKRMRTSDQKRPTVDWSREEIVALHAAGIGYGASSIQVTKVVQKPGGGLEVQAALARGDRPASPTPGVVPVMRREGIYTLIAVPPAKGEITLRVVDPPSSSGDRSGTPGSR